MFLLTDLTVDFDVFGLGPFDISELHAELVRPAVGTVRNDGTATIEDGAIRMQVTLSASMQVNRFGGKLLFSDRKLPISTTNDGPVTMIIDTENNIQIVDASFALPSKIQTRLTTASTMCTPEE
jgi:hypothetical protein